MSPQAPQYLVKYVADSTATSSGPHGISLSTTMDDDVFMDGTLREVEEKTPDSHEDVSERSVVKVSPGAVRQEVSQAISDKKGTLIILKEAEGGEAKPGEEDRVCASTEKEKGEAPSTKTAILKSPVEIKTDEVTHIKATDSPKKAMASWISEEAKAEASEVVSASPKEIREMKTSDAEIFTFEEKEEEEEQAKTTVSESTATSLAVVLYEY